MWLFYLIACVPVGIGAFLWLKNEEVVWQEWLAGSIIAFITAGITHYSVIRGMIDDVETLSGQVTQVEFHPEWVERWIQVHVETYSCGDDDICTRTYTTVEYDRHRLHWEARVDFGSEQVNWEIPQDLYKHIRRELGGHIETGPLQDFHHGGTHESGDQKTYVTDNRTGFIRPVTKTKRFENRVKVAPSVFSFVKVPTNVAVHAWPSNPDPWNSQRLLGTAAALIPLLEWDQMCARLGPSKRVNMILAGFGDKGSEIAQWQQSKFIGGKKNDLVICFGGGAKENGIYRPDWVNVFGWTEKEQVKKNLQTLILENGVHAGIIPMIEKEVRANYEIKDWSKFDYLKIEPTRLAYLLYIMSVIIIQGALWFWFHMNEYQKYGW